MKTNPTSPEIPLKTRILHLLELLTVNFWMIPLLFLLMAAVLAFANIYLDQALFSGWGASLPFPFYFKDADNFRSLLSLTANSMLSVTGMAFSITIASLTLASQQFGPRLLRNFMKTQFNQVVMGFFIGTFLYCVLLLQFSSRLEETDLTPVISLATLLVLIITDLLLLVFFFHHTAMSIQADTIISEVHKELSERLETLFPQLADNSETIPAAALQAEDQERFEREGHAVQAQHSGYLQAIDVTGLQHYVTEHDMALKLAFRPGDFLMQGSCLGLCLGQGAEDEDARSAINRYLIVGDTRTAEQDAEFAVRQLVEIAVRAMSPGINDPFTAITCIDRLGNALAFLLTRQFPAEQHFDENARLRLQLKPFTFAGILGAAFNQIRQNTAFHVAVIISLLETLQGLAAQARMPE
ncbi:MAG: DUF2254 domain-containing protein [Thiothrix sp.]